MSTCRLDGACTWKNTDVTDPSTMHGGVLNGMMLGACHLQMCCTSFCLRPHLRCAISAQANMDRAAPLSMTRRQEPSPSATDTPFKCHQDVLLLRLGARISTNEDSTVSSLCLRRLVGVREYSDKGVPLAYASHSYRYGLYTAAIVYI